VNATAETDKQGRVVKIVLTPEFGRAGDLVALATCASLAADGRELESFTLKVSGRDGRVHRKKPGGVEPLCDRPREGSG
jgi:hypothetical protein